MQRFEQLPMETMRDSARADEATAFMWGTYRWMSLGLAVTGLVAWSVANSEAAIQLLWGNRAAFWILAFAQVGMVLSFNSVAQRASAAATGAMFLAYSALTGLTFSAIFLVYTEASIAQVFFVSAGSFAGLSIYGATTKRDLSAMGRFMFIGLFGLILASLVNIFFQNPAIYWVSTYAGVLIFAGLTAYDTQKLRAMFLAQGDKNNLALRGALRLYLDFINLFLFLLRILGNRRN